MKEFKESDVVRDDYGRFAEQGGDSGAEKKRLAEIVGENEKSPEDITELLGKEFKGYKGQAAVDKLLAEKNGHIKGAFSRSDIGEIDLLWGNGDVGLQHIIKERGKQGIDATTFISTLADTIESGELRKTLRRDKETGLLYTSYEIIKNRQVAVVQPEFKGNKFNFVVTAFKTRKASWN